MSADSIQPHAHAPGGRVSAQAGQVVGCAAGLNRRIEKPLAVPNGMQSRYRTWNLRQRRPPGDGTGLFSGLLIVGDPGVPSPQLDGGGELAFLLEHGADRGSICFGDDIHPPNMETQARAGKRGSIQPSRCGPPFLRRPAMRSPGSRAESFGDVPGSLTTRGRWGTGDGAPLRVAFRYTESVGIPN
jgi:hypothetical protein